MLKKTARCKPESNQKNLRLYGKFQSGLFTVLSVICLFVVASALLLCMTLRYYLKSTAIPEAVAKIMIQEIRIPQADGSEQSISEYIFDKFLESGNVSVSEQDAGKILDKILNDSLPKYSGKFLNETILDAIKGRTGILLRVAVSVWIEILLGILMVLLLVWMIQIRLRSGKSAGTALKIYSITTVIPCTSLFLCGLLLDWIFKLIDLPPELGTVLRGGTLLTAGIGMLICVVLFCIGMIWNRIHRKKFPAQMPVPESDLDSDPDPEIELQTGVNSDLNPDSNPVRREYCRFCGEKLVNPDAQFCYHCGSRQP